MRTITSIVNTIKPGCGIDYPLTVGSLPFATATEAIALQARCGVHFPSTGEPASFRNENMETGFFNAFEGLSIIDGRRVATGEIKLVSSADLSRLDIVTDIEEAKVAIDKLVANGQYPEFIALKATLCGPGFLAQKVNDLEEAEVRALMGRFAKDLLEIAQIMYDRGARIIQIDEPFFTIGRRHRLSTIQALQWLVAQLRFQLQDNLFISLHMCGQHDLATREMLGNLNVDLLDAEFRKHPMNYTIFQNEWLLEKEKNIGIGVVSGDKETPEMTAEIVSDVNRIFEQYTPDIVVLKPDCQLRLRTPEQAAAKLEKVQQARAKAVQLLT